MSLFDLFFFLELLLRTAAVDLPNDLLDVSALIPEADESEATDAAASGMGGTCGDELGETCNNDF